LDDDLLQHAQAKQFGGGTTAAITLIRGDQLVVANIGDTRIVICHKGRAVLLSEMHLASNPSEAQSVIERGGKITNDPWGTPRLDGRLMVTRGLGPVRNTIAGLSPVPYVRNYKLTDDDSFLILGTDGIFNVMSNQEAVDIVKACDNPAKAAQRLVEVAYFDHKTDDNATAIVARLKGWGKYRDVNYNQLLQEYKIHKFFGNKIELPDCLVPLITQNLPRNELIGALFEMFDLNKNGKVSK